MTSLARSSRAWILKIAGVLLLGIVVSASSCDPLIASYDHGAYQQATNAKAEVLALVDKSGEPYSKHAKEVQELLLSLDKAYEYSKGRPQNSITTRQWELIKNPNGNLVGGFVRLWEKKGSTTLAYRDAKKKQLGKAFDEVICLEVNKKETTECAANKKAADDAGKDAEKEEK